MAKCFLCIFVEIDTQMAKIKTSDLYQDTGELKELIKQIEAAIDATKEMQGKVKESAKQMAKEIENLSGVHQEEREVIVDKAKQVDEMTKRMNKYSESMNQSAVELAALKEAQRIMNHVNKLEAQILMTKEGSYNRLSAQYSLNKIRLNQMSAAERAVTKEGRALEKQKQL